MLWPPGVSAAETPYGTPYYALAPWGVSSRGPIRDPILCSGPLGCQQQRPHMGLRRRAQQGPTGRRICSPTLLRTCSPMGSSKACRISVCLLRLSYLPSRSIRPEWPHVDLRTRRTHVAGAPHLCTAQRAVVQTWSRRGGAHPWLG